VVRRRLAQAPSVVSAFWVRVDGDRESYKAELTALFKEEAVVSLIVRGALFENPNSAMADLIDLIQQNREAFAHSHEDEGGRSKWGIVLLGRSELSLAQASSPVTLPEWFPVHGGRTIHTMIEDLTWTADSPLSNGQLAIDELCRELFDLEGILLQRLHYVHTQNHNASNSFLQLIRRKTASPESYHEILVAAGQCRQEIKNPGGFRPSVKEGRSLTARLWQVVNTAASEQLGAPSLALADALGLSDKSLPTYHESILAVLFRPSTRDSSPRVRFCRNLLITIGSICQLVTAAAHSDAYGSYPLLLLRTLSQDLRKSLLSAQETLRDVVMC